MDADEEMFSLLESPGELTSPEFGDNFMVTGRSSPSLFSDDPAQATALDSKLRKLR